MLVNTVSVFDATNASRFRDDHEKVVTSALVQARPGRLYPRRMTTASCLYNSTPTTSGMGQGIAIRSLSRYQVVTRVSRYCTCHLLRYDTSDKPTRGVTTPPSVPNSLAVPAFPEGMLRQTVEKRYGCVDYPAPIRI